MAAPRILAFDIETLPNLVASFGLKVAGGYLNPDGIVKEKCLVSAAWKWVGGKNVGSISLLDGGGTPEWPDKGIITRMHGLLNEADAVVAHFGNGFDVPWVNGQMMLQGFSPPEPFIQIDTWAWASKKANFNSNRLAYLAKRFGFGEKIKTDFELWMRCLRLEKDAIKEMVTYNKQDVRVLEDVYLEMRPWFPARLNFSQFEENEEIAERICPSCGSPSLIAYGYTYTRTGKRRNLRCGRDGTTRGCGAWSYRLLTKNGLMKLRPR